MTDCVLVTGASGQLGKELAKTKPDNVEAVFLSRRELDVTDLRAVHRIIEKIQPVHVINTAAYTKVDNAEAEVSLAFAINETGSSNLAEACKAYGARLLHISTDFVFDGYGHRPIGVDATPQPLGVYGNSKLSGENAVRGILPEDSLVLRVSWLYSRFGSNFVKTMLRLMNERDEIGVVADQVGCPTWAHSLAEFCWIASASSGVGVYHYADDGQCSWYEFACAIQSLATATGLLERNVQINPLSTQDYPTAAVRPAYSVLDTTTTRRDFDWKPLYWRRQLQTMIEGMTSNGT